jgi:hypothetical protein
MPVDQVNLDVGLLYVINVLYCQIYKDNNYHAWLRAQYVLVTY